MTVKFKLHNTLRFEKFDYSSELEESDIVVILISALLQFAQ